MISIGHWKDTDSLLQVRSKILHGSEKSDVTINHACRFLILSSLEGFVISWGNRQTCSHASLSQIIAAL